LLRFMGQSVVLPCVRDPSLDLRALTVLWSHSGLQGAQYVHEYRGQHQDPSERTHLSPQQLSAGNASLHIAGLNMSDSGAYTCSI
ncbi:hypothetical protein NL108_010684, partial [Boleophthalmus pectinirostris]